MESVDALPDFLYTGQEDENSAVCFCGTHDVVDCRRYELLTMSETIYAYIEAGAYRIINAVGSGNGLNGGHGTLV